MKRKVISNMRLIQIILFLCWAIPSFSQGFKVKDFKQNINDGSAFHAPIDAFGHPCGLIKVRTDDGDLKFKGNVFGEVENKTNEYWVFMSQGSKTLNILHPNYLPITVDFASYGIDEVASKATYILTLIEQKFKKEKCGLITTVKPETASLFVNDVLIENISGNGLYQLYLPKGDYVCRIEQKGFRPNVQAITIGKGTQNLSVELESLMAELEVKCKTGTADIFIDGELKGTGAWKGSIFAGKHLIEARQQNYESMIQSISLAEKETKTLSIPELKRSMGKIRIETMPSNMLVEVDGKPVGLSPCTIDIESGKHYACCRTYGIKQVRSDFEVNSHQTETVTLQIQYLGGWKKEEYQNAYNGDADAILWLAIEKGRSESEDDAPEAVFWIERHPKKETLLTSWYSYWKTLPEERKEYLFHYFDCEWILAYSNIGKPERALELYSCFKEDAELNNIDDITFNKKRNLGYIGNGFLKKKEYDKAMRLFEQADKYGYEGMGDYYIAKGNKQLAASYYRKCLDLDCYSGSDYDGKNRVEKKLKEINM